MAEFISSAGWSLSLHGGGHVGPLESSGWGFQRNLKHIITGTIVKKP